MLRNPLVLPPRAPQLDCRYNLLDYGWMNKIIVPGRFIVKLISFRSWDKDCHVGRLEQNLTVAWPCWGLDGQCRGWLQGGSACLLLGHSQRVVRNLSMLHFTSCPSSAGRRDGSPSLLGASLKCAALSLLQSICPACKSFWYWDANAVEAQKRWRSGHRWGAVCVLTHCRVGIASRGGCWEAPTLPDAAWAKFASQEQREGRRLFMAVPCVCRAFKNKDWLMCSGLSCSYLQDPEQLLSVFSLLPFWVILLYFFFKWPWLSPSLPLSEFPGFWIGYSWDSGSWQTGTTGVLCCLVFWFAWFVFFSSVLS